MTGPRLHADEAANARKMLEATKGDPEYDPPEVDALPRTPTQGAYSTDLGNVSWNVPTERFVVADSPFTLTVHGWQAAAIDLFRTPAWIADAKRDFEERKKATCTAS